jgi:hypothetical protein
MQRSSELFQIAPDEFFAGIDRDFAEIRATLAEVAQRAEAVGELCEAVVRTRAAPPAAGAPASRWTFDARLPNFLFADVFEPEPLTDGAKRWVGGSGRIAAALRLPRHVQYDFAIQVEEFASEAAARSFWLRINGVQYPWLDHAGKRYTSIVLDDADADGLNFEIGVDPASLPDTADVSFSFRSIDVSRRQSCS